MKYLNLILTLFISSFLVTFSLYAEDSSYGLIPQEMLANHEYNFKEMSLLTQNDEDSFLESIRSDIDDTSVSETESEVSNQEEQVNQTINNAFETYTNILDQEQPDYKPKLWETVFFQNNFGITQSGVIGQLVAGGNPALDLVWLRTDLGNKFPIRPGFYLRHNTPSLYDRYYSSPTNNKNDNSEAESNPENLTQLSEVDVHEENWEEDILALTEHISKTQNIKNKGKLFQNLMKECQKQKLALDQILDNDTDIWWVGQVWWIMSFNADGEVVPGMVSVGAYTWMRLRWLRLIKKSPATTYVENNQSNMNPPLARGKDWGLRLSQLTQRLKTEIAHFDQNLNKDYPLSAIRVSLVESVTGKFGVASARGMVTALVHFTKNPKFRGVKLPKSLALLPEQNQYLPIDSGTNDFFRMVGGKLSQNLDKINKKISLFKPREIKTPGSTHKKHFDLWRIGISLSLDLTGDLGLVTLRSQPTILFLFEKNGL